MRSDAPKSTALSLYQQSESPASAFTVRMNRPDAQTWSHNHGFFDGLLRYADNPWLLGLLLL